MAHEFLSEAWFGEAEKIQGEIAPPVPQAIQGLTINLKITGAPGGDVLFRLQDGRMVRGHAPDAPTKLSIPFATARSMLIEQDQQAVMQAFMSGQIVVEGDISKLMQMQMAGPPGPEAQQVSARIKAMTA